MSDHEPFGPALDLGCKHNLVNGGAFYVCTKCNGEFDDLGNPVAQTLPQHAPGCALLWVPPGARCTCPGPDGKTPPLGREPELPPAPRLRIKTDGTPQGTTIEANGVDLGNVCYGFSVDFDVSRRPLITLRCYEIDLELTERHGDPAGNVNFYKACANCEAELLPLSPAPIVSPAVPGPSGMNHLLDVVTDAKGKRVCSCGWDQL